MTLVGGEEFNGIEYWRCVFSENVGGSAQLANLERGHFIAFPNCPNLADLEPHLKQWIELKNKYGVGLPDDHLIGMFWSVIPEGMKEDVKKQKDLVGKLEGQINWVFGEIAERTDSKLSKWNLSKLQKQLKPQTKNSTGIHAVGATGDAPTQSPPVPDMATFAATVERSLEKMVNAAISRGRPTNRTPTGSRSGSNSSQRAGRRIPSASFDGCWCCGKKGHSRKDCPEFKAVKAKNGGKVPKDYVGAWEKTMKAKPSTPVGAVGVSSTDKPTEHEETVHIFPVLPMPTPVITHNKYGTLTDFSDDDDDESDLVKALSAITPNVHMKNDHVSQKTRRSQQYQSRSLNIAHLNAVARDVKSGKIALPDINVSNNDEFEYVWALVDSGAGANVARRSMFTESVPVQAPSISLSTANGESLPHSGAHKVTSYNKDGSKVTRTFYDANVEMPILAVSEISKEGRHGSDVRLRQKDGYIRDNYTGHRQPVVKRRGVYFTKMYIRKPGSRINDSVFSRPGQP